jgi:hypothetical protein
VVNFLKMLFSPIKALAACRACGFFALDAAKSPIIGLLTEFARNRIAQAIRIKRIAFYSGVWFKYPVEPSVRACSGSNNATLTEIWY